MVMSLLILPAVPHRLLSQAVLGHLQSIAFRLFFFLTVGGPVFGHPGITHVTGRIWREDCATVLHGVDSGLLRLGLLSGEMYADSTLVQPM